ncbi:helix-turn-helix transcriptional regulator [Scytonema hofmannii FACHB-248]|uniref:Helix-turn-helix transcriptional regulator n=1 Tax=Scytonema hofmannii FACHB-248 TaxID=1842502 RepID=A0ABR8GQU7_9CYAN|nr:MULTISPECIES: LuxR family transcriptional regulator [Nostocales]MBD2605564.1 helix-turn-helix transcriptional regulator [Scytonema hofmannii FACHB-248]
MTISNRKKLVAASENQNLLALEQEALLKVLVRQVTISPPRKLPQTTNMMLNEVIFESDVDGVHYYLVRCSKEKSISHLQFASQENPSFDGDADRFEEKINLSPREIAIAKLVAQGLSNKCIAIRLQISPWTVATHLRRIFVKLGVTSRTAMITCLLEENSLHK